MISSSLHPGSVRAACRPRRRLLPAGLTVRTILLLLAGFVWLTPGFWNSLWSYATPAWDFLVLMAALLDGVRLPKAGELTVRREWLNTPALDGEAEIELSVENHGRTIIECRLVDDLPSALVA